MVRQRVIAGVRRANGYGPIVSQRSFTTTKVSGRKTFSACLLRANYRYQRIV